MPVLPDVSGIFFEQREPGEKRGVVVIPPRRCRQREGGDPGVPGVLCNGFYAPDVFYVPELG